MSDDVTNLAEVLAVEICRERVKRAWDPRTGCPRCTREAAPIAQAILASNWLAERDGAHRLIGAAMANTDAIAAYAELVERVEGLADDWPCSDETCDGDCTGCAYARDLRALIDPEATS